MRIKHPAVSLGALAAALLLLYAVSVLTGRYPEPGITPPSVLRSDPMAGLILLTIRLPRCTAAVLLGIALGCGGMVFQLLFSNPLIEPGMLGVSQGSAFGAGLVILFGGPSLLLLQAGAAAAGLAGLGLSYILARRLRFGGWLLRLILAGIAVSALFSAGLGLIKTQADPLSELPELTLWLLGGLSGVSAADLKIITPAVIIPAVLLSVFGWKINILSAGEETAFSMGVNPRTARLAVLILAVIPVAAVTAVAGIVQWAGLIVPHIARRLFGADAARSIPASALLGGIFGLLCDDAARLLLPGEIPLGILTALFGVILFVIILTRSDTEQTC